MGKSLDFHLVAADLSIPTQKLCFWLMELWLKKIYPYFHCSSPPEKLT
jgi:hypothetical protein